ncbi:MAG: cytidylate kinase family protein, partial [Desulfovermiculus sp.]|nr:cytidylate kinase family protein [Desulfovermiculus sp.]
MAIITISRESYSQGRQVAEKLGQRLGYKVISREVLISTSEEFNIPEI